MFLKLENRYKMHWTIIQKVLNTISNQKESHHIWHANDLLLAILSTLSV